MQNEIQKFIVSWGLLSSGIAICTGLRAFHRGLYLSEILGMIVAYILGFMVFTLLIGGLLWSLGQVFIGGLNRKHFRLMSILAGVLVLLFTSITLDAELYNNNAFNNSKTPMLFAIVIYGSPYYLAYTAWTTMFGFEESPEHRQQRINDLRLAESQCALMTEDVNRRGRRWMLLTFAATFLIAFGIGAINDVNFAYGIIWYALIATTVAIITWVVRRDLVHGGRELRMLEKQRDQLRR